MNGYWELATMAPEGKPVLTCIMENGCCRQEARLKRSGRLWLVPDGGMYVYYTPTHYWVWR